jgi:O-methyltransferase involved in polyketide biosynthesis
MRALHTRLDRPSVIEDVWGDRLVPASERDAFAEALMSRLDAAEARAQMAAHGSPQAILEAVLRAHPAYGIVIVRTRYAEDALEAAVASGVRQYVIIGAGMDGVTSPSRCH